MRFKLDSLVIRENYRCPMQSLFDVCLLRFLPLLSQFEAQFAARGEFSGQVWGCLFDIAVTTRLDQLEDSVDSSVMSLVRGVGVGGCWCSCGDAVQMKEGCLCGRWER